MPNLIGTAPNQVPVNGLLGTLAFQDSSSVTISGGSIGGVPVSSLAASVLQGEQLDTIASSSSLVLRGGATNLFTYSEQFDNAAWFKGLSSVTANTTIAPDGTLTADTLSFSAAANANLQPTTPPTVTIGQQYTYSVYVRASSAVSNVNIAMAGSDVAIAVTTEWQRVSRTVTASVSTLGPVLVTRTDVATDIYIWGAQLQAASTAGAYLKTEATAVSTAYAAPIESPNGIAVPLLTSMTPARNGDMTFQLTSNTSLTIKVKGSDGTVRSVALTLA